MAGSICWLHPCHTASGQAEAADKGLPDRKAAEVEAPPLQPQHFNVLQATKAGDQELLGRFKPSDFLHPVHPLPHHQTEDGAWLAFRFQGLLKRERQAGKTKEGAGRAEACEIIWDAEKRDV